MDEKAKWKGVAAGLALMALVPAGVLWGAWRGAGAAGTGHKGLGEDGTGTWAVAGQESGRGEAAGGWAWEVLKGAGGGEAKAEAGGPGSRYRLAGVLTVREGEGLERGEDDLRYAILDRLADGRQLVLGEGEAEAGVRAVRIENEYVVLSEGGREEMVFLAASALGEKRGGGAGGGGGMRGEAAEPLERNRFGARVGEARWEIERAELVKYAQEVMDDPRRVSGMYMGMEPDYDEEREVAGYRLNTKCGEAEFYGMVGLQDGDVFRRVNSIKMTSQRRAEFLLGEFFQERLGTVVLDIERDGEAKKLVYLLR